MYQQRTNREFPSLVVLLLDQSGSMAETTVVDGQKMSKAEALANAVNSVLYELILRCIKDTSEGPRHYYDIAVIGYGQTSRYSVEHVGPAWTGQLEGRLVIPSSEVGVNPLRVDRVYQSGGPANIPVWIEPQVGNFTPMCAAFDLTGKTVADWISQHPNSFPPVVIHVTDGDSTDGDPTVWAERLKNLATTDGNVLLLNLSLLSQQSNPVIFPTEESYVGSKLGRQLLHMSSHLPEFMIELAASRGFPARKGSKGVIVNADISLVPSFFQIGTATTHVGR